MTSEEKGQVKFAVNYARKQIQEIEQSSKSMYTKENAIDYQLTLLCVDLVPCLPRALQAQAQACIDAWKRARDQRHTEVQAKLQEIEAQKKARSESLATANEL